VFQSVSLQPYGAFVTCGIVWEKYIKESENTKFLGVQIDNHLNWKNRIDQIVSKVSRACYAIRSMSHVSNTVTLKAICFTYFHSTMKYGIIFLG
jgi:hypothetical protein